MGAQVKGVLATAASPCSWSSSHVVSVPGLSMPGASQRAFAFGVRSFLEAATEEDGGFLPEKILGAAPRHLAVELALAISGPEWREVFRARAARAQANGRGRATYAVR
jgi:hypothetical protein